MDNMASQAGTSRRFILTASVILLATALGATAATHARLKTPHTSGSTSHPQQQRQQHHTTLLLRSGIVDTAVTLEAHRDGRASHRQLAEAAAEQFLYIVQLGATPHKQNQHTQQRHLYRTASTSNGNSNQYRSGSSSRAPLVMHNVVVLDNVRAATGLTPLAHIPHNAYLFHATPAQAHVLRTAVTGVSWVGAYLAEHKSEARRSLRQALQDEHRHRSRHAQAAATVPDDGIIDSNHAAAHATTASALEHHVAAMHVLISTVHTQSRARTQRLARALASDWHAAAAVAAPVPPGVAFGVHHAGVVVARINCADAAEPATTAACADTAVAVAAACTHHEEVVWVEPGGGPDLALNKFARWNTQGMQLDHDVSAEFGVCPSACLQQAGSCLASPACRIPACHYDPADCYDTSPVSPLTQAGLSGKGGVRQTPSTMLPTQPHSLAIHPLGNR